LREKHRARVFEKNRVLSKIFEEEREERGNKGVEKTT